MNCGLEAMAGHTMDLTIAAGNVTLPAADPVGYVSEEGNITQQNVVYYGMDGNLHRLWAGGKWEHKDMGPIVG